MNNITNVSEAKYRHQPFKFDSILWSLRNQKPVTVERQKYLLKEHAFLALFRVSNTYKYFRGHFIYNFY